MSGLVPLLFMSLESWSKGDLVALNWINWVGLTGLDRSGGIDHRMQPHPTWPCRKGLEKFPTFGTKYSIPSGLIKAQSQ